MLVHRPCASNGGMSMRLSPVGRAHLWSAGLLAVAFVLIAFAAPAGDTLDVGGHAFEFRSVEYNGDGSSTWTYVVTSARKPALSHWVLEFDRSLKASNVVRCSEIYEVNSDPTTSVYGLKFDEGYQDDETREVSFVLDAWYVAVETRVATKAGKNVVIGGPIPGPGIEISASNVAPTATDDVTSTDAEIAVRIDVTANDEDSDGTIDRTTVLITTDPKAGSASADPTTGVVTYVPDRGRCGSDYFKYKVKDDDGALSEEARVTIEVVCNAPPIAEDDAATTDEDTAVGIHVLANDRDPDGTLDARSVAISKAPKTGSISVHPTTGVVTYSPNKGACGDDVFEYTVRDDDGAVSGPARVTVAVLCNDPPLAVDDLYTVAEGETLDLSAPGVLANDKDAPGSPLSAILVTGVRHGTLTLRADGSLTYVHDGTETTNDAFTYVANDGAKDSNPANVSLVIHPTNDAPEASDDEAATDEDVSVTIAVLANDRDPDGNALSVDWTTQPANGRVTNLGGQVRYAPNPDFYGTETFSYAVSDGQGGTATATVTVAVREVNDLPVAEDDTAATDEDVAVSIDILANDEDPDGDALSVKSTTRPRNGSVDNRGDSLFYTPDLNFQGTDTFTYVVSDGRGGTASALVTIAVAQENDRPVAVDDEASTLEDSPVTISVLANDSDPDGDRLIIESSTQPRHGATLRSGNSIVYTPNPDYFGEDGFTYTASDGHGGTATATVIVTVTSVNDLPTAQDDSGVTKEGAPVVLEVLANDGDPDNDALTIQSVVQPSHGIVVNGTTRLTYVPNAGFSGTDTFTYVASDGRGGTGTARVTVAVSPVNDAPRAQNDSAVVGDGSLVMIDVLGNDSDPDGDFLLVQSIEDPAHGSVLNSRTGLSYIPDPGFQGVDIFSYTVSDGNGGTATALVTVSVAAGNGAPIARDDSGVTEEGVAVALLVLLNDSDPDGDPLEVESVTQPSVGSVETDGEVIRYTPGDGSSGVARFSYTVSDGRGGTATADVVVVVTPVNDAPTAQADSANTDRGVAVSIPALENDSDPDGDPLSLVAVTQPRNGTTVITGTEILYTPDEGFVGVDSFSYTIADREGLSATASVTVGVAGEAGGGGAVSGAPCDGKVIISEVAWAGTAADDEDEWIELRNVGTAPVDLTGWVVRWRRTRPSKPEDNVWKVVELSGVLSPSSPSACDPVSDPLTTGVLVSKNDASGVSWRVSYPSERGASGYCTLQRRHEATVSDVRSDMLYDTGRAMTLGLSDLGEVVMLVNDRGEIVDTANASNIGRDGWVAGSASTFGSMERVNPLGPDVASNWNTNVGLVIHGEDAKKHPLRATPGAPNSPVLENLFHQLGIKPTVLRVGQAVSVSFSLSKQDRKATGWPWIIATRAGLDFSAGGGGSIDLSAYSFSGRYANGDQYVLEIGTKDVPPGEHVFWIVYGEGQALLVCVLLMP